MLVSDWGPSEPNNLTFENCVVIAEKAENRGHWADVNCERHEHFICEKGKRTVLYLNYSICEKGKRTVLYCNYFICEKSKWIVHYL